MAAVSLIAACSGNQSPTGVAVSTAAQLRIVSVAPGPKRRTFLLQLNRPLTKGEAAELDVRGENPEFSGLGESTLSVASEDNSILVTGEMSAGKLEAQMPDLEKLLTLVEQQGHELDELEEEKAEQARAQAAEHARRAESEQDKVALARINQRLQNQQR
jgi:hypothetical protein